MAKSSSAAGGAAITGQQWCSNNKFQQQMHGDSSNPQVNIFYDVNNLSRELSKTIIPLVTSISVLLLLLIRQ